MLNGCNISVHMSVLLSALVLLACSPRTPSSSSLLSSLLLSVLPAARTSSHGHQQNIHQCRHPAGAQGGEGPTGGAGLRLRAVCRCLHLVCHICYFLLPCTITTTTTTTAPTTSTMLYRTELHYTRLCYTTLHHTILLYTVYCMPC